MRSLIKRLFKTAGIPNGHYYSPVINIDEVRKSKVYQGSDIPHIEGVDLNVSGQLALAANLQKYFSPPFSESKSEKRYYFQNHMFLYTDAIILYACMRHFKPRKIIEAGSGFSSAVMLDTKDLHLPELELTFIEPYPERFNSLLSSTDRINLLQSNLQDVPLDTFDQLQRDDILFIDSSHVSKTGSDVNYTIFEILPRLAPGVIIHIHDIFYPFEYPMEWIEAGRSWNEAYLIRAFLMYNNQFKIVFFNSFLHKFHKEIFSSQPLFYKNTGASLWVQKV